MNRVGTVALIIKRSDQNPVLVDALSDDQEISILEVALHQGEQDPLNVIYGLREQRVREDEEFGDYVEELLCRPFVKPEVQVQGVQWLKSKMKIDDFKKKEAEATQVIAHYAYRVYQENPAREEFILAGPTARVRIRIFTLPAESQMSNRDAA